jgi:hypothetical protein
LFTYCQAQASERDCEHEGAGRTRSDGLLWPEAHGERNGGAGHDAIIEQPDLGPEQSAKQVFQERGLPATGAVLVDCRRAGR